jgi:hypothetical protein
MIIIKIHLIIYFIDAPPDLYLLEALKISVNLAQIIVKLVLELEDFAQVA